MASVPPQRSLVKMSDLVRSVAELGFARLRLSSRKLRSVAPSGLNKPDKLDSNLENLVERIAYVIPRVAAYLPWRADCVVQAIAAAHWLRSAGIDSKLHFGVLKSNAEIFEGHAWLTVGERIVTGGDVKKYSQLLPKL